MAERPGRLLILWVFTTRNVHAGYTLPRFQEQFLADAAGWDQINTLLHAEPECLRQVSP